MQVGECRSDEQILLETGKRLNPDTFPWNNVEEMLDFMLSPCGLTFAELREQGIPEYQPFEYKKYEKGLLNVRTHQPANAANCVAALRRWYLSIPSGESISSTQTSNESWLRDIQ